MAYEKNGLKIDFQMDRTEDTGVTITSIATNSNTVPLNEFVFQAAVPKVMRLLCTFISTFSFHDALI